MRQYVTFGQVHVHSVNGKTFDKDCVAVFEADDAASGRDRAFEIFGPKFCFHYAGDEFQESEMLSYFPRGLVEV